MKVMAGVAAGTLLAMCGTAAGADSPLPTDWRKVATSRDRDRLRTWRQAWMTALGQVRAAGDTAAIDAEGTLFDPDRVLTGATPPAGRYRCRVFKLGAKGAAGRDFSALPPVECRVGDESGIASLYKVGGSQRPVGLVFADTPSRDVFLGTMVFGDETRAIDYGRDAGRDMAGYVERIGARRWRLVLPYPRFESILDVVELVPAERRQPAG